MSPPPDNVASSAGADAIDRLSPLLFRSELPFGSCTLNGPLELLTQSLGEESLDWHVELLAEDDCKTWIDVVLQKGQHVSH